MWSASVGKPADQAGDLFVVERFSTECIPIAARIRPDPPCSLTFPRPLTHPQPLTRSL